MPCFRSARTRSGRIPEATTACLTPGTCRSFLEQRDLAAVVGPEGFADCGGKTTAIGAGPPAELFRAFEAVHVRRRPTDVEDVPLEIGEGGDPLRLPEDRGLAPGADRPPLVDGDRAEVALPVASPVGGDGEADRLERPDPPEAPVVGVDVPGEIHPVDRIHLRRTERRLRRVVDEPARVLPLGKPLRRQGVLVPVEAEEHLREGRMVGGRLLVGGELQRPRLRLPPRGSTGPALPLRGVPPGAVRRSPGRSSPPSRRRAGRPWRRSGRSGGPGSTRHRNGRSAGGSPRRPPGRSVWSL